MRPTKKFLCSYRHDDAEWSLIIDAYDWEDAYERVKKLRYLSLDGELMGTVPASMGWWVKLRCWIGNLSQIEKEFIILMAIFAGCLVLAVLIG